MRTPAPRLLPRRYAACGRIALSRPQVELAESYLRFLAVFDGRSTALRLESQLEAHQSRHERDSYRGGAGMVPVASGHQL